MRSAWKPNDNGYHSLHHEGAESRPDSRMDALVRPRLSAFALVRLRWATVNWTKNACGGRRPRAAILRANCDHFSREGVAFAEFGGGPGMGGSVVHGFCDGCDQAAAVDLVRDLSLDLSRMGF